MHMKMKESEGEWKRTKKPEEAWDVWGGIKKHKHGEAWRFSFSKAQMFKDSKVWKYDVSRAMCLQSMMTRMWISLMNMHAFVWFMHASWRGVFFDEFLIEHSSLWAPSWDIYSHEFPHCEIFMRIHQRSITIPLGKCQLGISTSFSDPSDPSDLSPIPPLWCLWCLWCHVWHRLWIGSRR